MAVNVICKNGRIAFEVMLQMITYRPDVFLYAPLCGVEACALQVAPFYFVTIFFMKFFN